MADIEKVIKGLECCSGKGGQCIYCPYDNGIEEANCRDNLDHDAIELLKEQEAKPPAMMQDIEGIWSTCSMCGHKLRPIFAMEMDTYFPKFCSKCGQAVKWE